MSCKLLKLWENSLEPHCVTLNDSRAVLDAATINEGTDSAVCHVEEGMGPHSRCHQSAPMNANAKSITHVALQETLKARAATAKSRCAQMDNGKAKALVIFHMPRAATECAMAELPMPVGCSQEELSSRHGIPCCALQQGWKAIPLFVRQNSLFMPHGSAALPLYFKTLSFCLMNMVLFLRCRPDRVLLAALVWSVQICNPNLTFATLIGHGLSAAPLH